MFWSDRYLAKTGPLAKVWLAANIERKLSKSQILQQDIKKSVDVITDQPEGPFALRTSSQLMLGVVKIYGKKAKYLQDDCHEALLKIRMTFKKTGNHDLPPNATTGLDLNLPELLTIDDLFPSMDFTYPLTQPPAAVNNDQDYDQDWTSTLNPNQSTQSRLSPDDQPLLEDGDLGLDFGDDLDPNNTTVSVQVGRNALDDRPLKDDALDINKIYEDDDLVLDLGDDVEMNDQPVHAGDAGEDNIRMLTADLEAEPQLLDDKTDLSHLPLQRRDSSLSEAGSGDIRNLDRALAQAEDGQSEVVVQQRQQRRKLKHIIPDVETVLPNRQIKQQSENRSKILKAPAFLPKDPFLLNLVNMQKNGDFVTQAMNDGRSRDWAPELQGLLSFDTVFRSGHKRKRDSGIGGLSEDEHSEKSPRLEIDNEYDEAIGLVQAQVDDVPRPLNNEQTLEESLRAEDDNEFFAAVDDTFDDTTLPILHPAESGPISVGTKRTVHLLRERFGSDFSGNGSPSSQKKTTVFLQDLVPEKTTSKEDATKMFFELLVLATKDAVKVEQSDKDVGLPLRIRAKRGLWGSWAETSPEDDKES